jgi:drug/metabolite transporter (DMT)-like permease
MKNKIIIYLEAFIAVFIWGVTFVATKATLKEVSPATIVWIRFGMGIIVLGITVGIRKQFSLPNKSELAYFAVIGFIGVTFHQWLQATGLMTAAATTTAWIVATIPIFTALLGWLILKEKLGAIRIFGITIATFGVMLIVSKGNLNTFMNGKFGTVGDFLILISALNWAVFSILSRRGLRAHPAALMMFYVMLFGWFFAGIWLFGFGPGLSEIPQLSINGWIGLVILGLFGSGIAYITWYDALQVLPASQASAFIYIEPLVTMIVASFILAEPITFIIIAGGALIIFGVYLVNRPSKQIPFSMELETKLPE